MSSTPAVVVDEVSKRFRLYKERNQSLKAALMRGGRASYDEYWALRGVSFEIPQGSTFALIGENGSGKSTLLKCIARILEPEKGDIRTQGTVAALLELGSGFHPELSGRENVFLNGSILGMTKRELERKFDEIVDFAGIEAFIDQPVKNYSSGMYMRLGFSVAINVDPDVLLVDEVLAVGDAAFQEKCMEKFVDFRRAGKTVVIVSHAMGSMRTLCDQAAWLDRGSLVEVGRADQIVDRYVDKSHEQEVVVPSSSATSASSDGAAPDGTPVQTRIGSGEAILTDVTVLDARGLPANRFRTGEQATIRISYECSERVERPAFALALDTVDGMRIWAHHTRDGGLDIAYIDGSGHIDLAIPNLTLQPYTFDLSARILDHTLTHTYDFLRHCYRFVVETGELRESGGVVALGGRWNADLPSIASEATV
ncbi:ABC transporter ATP-binding protein [Modestobacter sp. VKM Ac-2978]|uniref:ABC transporter ATP-binding protein n=1 Tax=Modestobacter sp. VKM Ac-2978 TaxID=3004132 RepID=UPI0022AA052C|nr:ABC transporter ATP-binding protein [Modestobacter sp. VKM Ac-2978]MCZ2849952.1 ABC transporter ATP-binding protein [Modestobacter sp. VKM Ac-2978]